MRPSTASWLRGAVSSAVDTWFMRCEARAISTLSAPGAFKFAGFIKLLSRVNTPAIIALGAVIRGGTRTSELRGRQQMHPRSLASVHGFIASRFRRTDR